MFPECEGDHGGVVLPDRVVDASVFELAEAILLVDLDDCNRAGELASAP